MGHETVSLPTAVPGSRKGLPKIFRLADRGVNTLTSLGAWVSSAFIFIMMVLIGVEVTMRSVFNKSTLVADEYTGYLMVAVVFMTLAYTSKMGSHIGVDILTKKMPERFRLVSDVVYYIIALVYVTILVRQFSILALDSLSGGAVAITVSMTPLFIPQLFMPVGLMIFELQLIAEFIKACRQLVIYRHRSEVTT